ncbi:DUF2178 domain-containing protein [bacterium]|nr:DUF2178 domain-containing protein [bacterium]
MTIKKYNIFRMIIVIALAIIFSQAIIFQNFLLSAGVLIIGSLIVYSMRKNVKEVMADERDYEHGGKAALLAMQIYCWMGVVAMFALKSQAYLNATYDIIANTLAFSICIFMLLYSFIFRLKSKGKFWNGWTVYTFIVLVLFIILAIMGTIKI